VLLAALACGCIHGPVALEASRVRYNEVIQSTTGEQLLLNLVRLQYREAPLFLEVGGVSAQFAFKKSADVVGTINEGPNPINPDVLDLKAGIAFEERPTVTLAPLQGSEFVGQLLSPLRLDVLVLLTRSGWSVDRVLRLAVQSMNGLDNASSASGPAPAQAPRYEAFARVTELFRELQKEGLLELGYETRYTDTSSGLAWEHTRLLDVVEAVDRGYQVRTGEDGETLTLAKPLEVLVWRMPPTPSPEAAEIVELLGLDPALSEYEIRPGLGRQTDPGTAAGRHVRIHVSTRSLLGSLFYLSQAVAVPDVHRDKGLVTTTVTPGGEPFDWNLVIGDLLRVRAQRTPPRDAAVSVRYRKHWYYIADDDLTSKSTFALLNQLFALQAGEVSSATPVLTLPVGG
jgi:hypothetical protein